MKRQRSRRLSISRETLRRLSSDDLRVVAGGITNNNKCYNTIVSVCNTCAPGSDCDCSGASNEVSICM